MRRVVCHPAWDCRFDCIALALMPALAQDHISFGIDWVA